MSGNSEPLKLDVMLARFRADGEAQDSGAFTIDSEKAVERSARFQLPDPYFWVLKVLQALHLSGAQELQIQAGGRKVYLLADVAPSGFDSIETLFSELMRDTSSANPALRHLAIGLRASLAIKSRSLTLRVRQDGQQREFVLKSGGWRDVKTSPCAEGEECFELTVIRSVSEKMSYRWFILNSNLSDVIFRRATALTKEKKVINERFDFARGEISLGKHSVNRREFGTARFKGYEISQDSDPGKTKPSLFQRWVDSDSLIGDAASGRHHLAELVVPSEKPGGFFLGERSHATVSNLNESEILEKGLRNGYSRAFALRMDLARTALIYFWEDGVLIDRKSFSGATPGLIALIDANGLQKDLTTFQVIENDEYERILDEVRASGKALKEQVLENLSLMPLPDTVRGKLDGGT